MATIRLIRHGQAGSRDNYDLLSDLGKRQSELLGQHMANPGLELHAIYSGSLNRQQETARQFIESFQPASSLPLRISCDENWNEFSLAAVYGALAPRLIAESKEFANDYLKMQCDLQSDPHMTRGSAGRCDRTVIEAWMENRFTDNTVETWIAFRHRIESNISKIRLLHEKDNIAIFTSATPIAIWVGMALGLTDEKILRLMAVIYNSSVTTFKLRENELLLLNFNTLPHLPDPELHTFR